MYVIDRRCHTSEGFMWSLLLSWTVNWNEQLIAHWDQQVPDLCTMCLSHERYPVIHIHKQNLAAGSSNKEGTVYSAIAVVQCGSYGFWAMLATSYHPQVCYSMVSAKSLMLSTMCIVSTAKILLQFEFIWPLQGLVTMPILSQLWVNHLISTCQCKNNDVFWLAACFDPCCKPKSNV